MIRTLYGKLALGLAVVLLAVGGIYTIISQMTLRHHLDEVNQQLNRGLAENLVADRNLVREGKLNNEALKETFDLYMSINPSIEIYVLDLDGKIISYSADPKKIKRNRVDLVPIKSFLTMEEPYPLLGDDPRSHDRQKAFSVTPIPSKSNPEGYLYVVLRGEQYETAEQLAVGSYFFRFSGLAMAVSLGVGLLAGLLVFHFIVGRLRRLSSVMQQFEESHFSSPIRYREGLEGPARYQKGRESATDEIDQLGIRFDQMAERIGDQIEQLRGQDALRRELVAQVSHDLRTPLAAILGYLESIQIKGDNLSPEQRQEFISIALRQGRHLSGLVDELFELASLDAKERQPVCEPFAPGELVNDVVLKHQLQAQEKDIDLKLQVPEDLSFAFGDIELTERVLDNLLDNAFSATDAGGKVDVCLSERNGHIEVAVEDTGHGISPADKTNIFKPFFRSESRKSDKKHAGLGLALASRIMELQNGDLTVESEPGQGARFALSLPKAPQ